VVDFLLQRALEMREALCGTPESHLLTEVVAAFPADETVAAWDADFQSDAVAEGEVLHVGADGDDDTGGFMAQREG